MKFLDSSALVAVLASEPDGEAIAKVIDDADGCVTSPLVVFETVLALVRIFQVSVSEATLLVLEQLHRSGVETLPITPETHILALRAHEDYGKGTGHPAQLNMGDCFSYAMAKLAGAGLIYKGDDFVHTDLA